VRGDGEDEEGAEMTQRDINTLRKADRNKLAWAIRVSGLLACPLQELSRRITDIVAGMTGKRCCTLYRSDDGEAACERPQGHGGPCGEYGRGQEFKLQLVLRGNHDIEDKEG
jgi:hypothetical protein